MFKTGKKQAIFFSNNCYFFQNPYNIELTKVLCSKGYSIVFCIEKQGFSVPKEFRKFKFIELPYDLPHRIVILKGIKLCFVNFFKSFSFLNLSKIYYTTKHLLISVKELVNQLVTGTKIMMKISWEAFQHTDNLFLGIDEFGYLFLHELSFWTSKSKKYFVSHELYFDDEIDPRIKFIKDTAHKVATKADFILSTDDERLNQLINGSKYKNSLRSIKALCIPVGYYSVELPPVLTNKKSKSVLYTGTISSACSVDQLVKLFESNQKLVNHSLNFHSYHLFEKYSSISLNNVSFNCVPIPEPKEYIHFINDFYIGLVLYFPDPQVGPHFGKNIKYIGLSSGKFSLLSMLGIPIICSDNQSFRKLRNSFNFGYIIKDVQEIPDAINNISTNYEMHASESKNMYDNVLCPRNSYEQFIKI